LCKEIGLPDSKTAYENQFSLAPVEMVHFHWQFS